jgi:hypothetical protein
MQEVLGMAQLRLLLVAVAFVDLEVAPSGWPSQALLPRFRVRAKRLAACEATIGVLSEALREVGPQFTSDGWKEVLSDFFTYFDFFCGDGGESLKSSDTFENMTTQPGSSPPHTRRSSAAGSTGVAAPLLEKTPR